MFTELAATYGLIVQPAVQDMDSSGRPESGIRVMLATGPVDRAAFERDHLPSLAKKTGIAWGGPTDQEGRTQTTYTLDDALEIIVVVRNDHPDDRDSLVNIPDEGQPDGWAPKCWIHAFRYDTPEDFARGLETQKVVDGEHMDDPFVAPEAVIEA